MTPIVETADAIAVLRNLGIALVAGFLVGFEREWTQDLEGQKHTFAGGRTFALIGFVGGLVGTLSVEAALVAAALAVVGALTIVGYWFEAKETPGRGGTTEVAIFATLLLGVAAGRGHPLIAAAGAVAVAIVLSLKYRVETWAKALDRREIHATLRFLAIALLVLPVLPDEEFGPYGALNPRSLWTMVVLISGLSFLGYWFVKILGGGRGVLATGVVGGLASSTATTLSLSKFAKDRICAPAAVAAGIVMANVVMLARVGVILGAMSTATLAIAAPALAAGAAVGGAIAYALWRAAPKDGEARRAVALGNPFELRPALYFASLIAVISVASAYGADKFGAAGTYVIGLISGLADVDAMTLSGGRQAATGSISPVVAAGAILLAVASNIAVKGVMALTIGGRRTGLIVLGAFAAIVAAGYAAFVLY
ncbi:MAG: MgtC/SapB family protein [Pseudomonadota bacterium]